MVGARKLVLRGGAYLLPGRQTKTIASTFSLNGTEDTEIALWVNRTLLDKMPVSRAITGLHEGAIYYHHGHTYRVKARHGSWRGDSVPDTSAHLSHRAPKDHFNKPGGNSSEWTFLPIAPARSRSTFVCQWLVIGEQISLEESAPGSRTYPWIPRFTPCAL